MFAQGLSLLLAGPQDDYVFLLGRLSSPSLPEGVLADMMLNLDPRDIQACRLVNKSWSRAAATATRHLDLPCKALAAAAASGAAAGDARGGTGPESVDAALRRLHRAWPAAEAITLSGLAASQALNAELSLPMLTNHLSRWRNLRELNLRDMPVSPVPAPPAATQSAPAPPLAPPARRGRAGPGPAAPAAEAYSGGWRLAAGSGCDGGGGPGQWSLGCLSCCLGLTRLEVELVAAREPLPLQPHPADPHHRHHHRCDPTDPHQQHGRGEPRSQQQQQQQRHRKQQQRRPNPAQLAAGQAALLEGLTRLTRLTQLSVRLLDLPAAAAGAAPPPVGRAGAAAAGADEADSEGTAVDGDVDTDSKGTAVDGDVDTDSEGTAVDGDVDTDSDSGEGTERGEAGAAPAAAAAAASGRSMGRPQAISAAAAAPAVAAEEEYVLDVEEAGNYGSDLDMDLDVDSDVGLDPGGSDPDREVDGAGAVEAEAAPEGGGSALSAAPREPAAASFAGAVPASGPKAPRRRQLNGGLQQPQQLEHLGEANEGCESSSDSSGYGSACGDAARSSGGSSHSSRRRSSSKGGDGRHADGGGGAAAAAATPGRAAAVGLAARHWSPQPALFARLGPRLRSLRLTGCDLRGGGALAALAGALTGLTSLSLQGRLGVSHDDLAALSGLRGLRDLSLSRVELLYDPRDPDDCPVALMTELYGALQQLSRFQSLSFDLDTCGGSGIHSAYLLPLYDSPLARLAALNLSTVVLDSDYSFHMLAELTSLSSLTLSYVTWPLALQCDDMTLLAPLSGLRRFSMRCEPSERHHLISLSGRVVEVLAGAWPHLSQLAFMGQILPDMPGAPSLRCLAAWTSLRDLSLSAAQDEEDDGDAAARHPHHLTPGYSPGRNGCGAASDGDDGSSGVTAGGDGGAGTDMPYMNVGGGGCANDDDEGGAAAAAAAGAVDLGVCLGLCLPRGLTRLALSGLRLRGGELLALLAGSLTGLTSLQVLDCGLTPAHLMVGDTGATQLQVLVLNDSRAWRACGTQLRSAGPCCSYDPCRNSAPARAAAARRLQPGGPASQDRAAAGLHRAAGCSDCARPCGGPPRSCCSCCCSPSIWAARRCLRGLDEPTAREAGALRLPQPAAAGCCMEGRGGKETRARAEGDATTALPPPDLVKTPTGKGALWHQERRLQQTQRDQQEPERRRQRQPLDGASAARSGGALEAGSGSSSSSSSSSDGVERRGCYGGGETGRCYGDDGGGWGSSASSARDIHGSSSSSSGSDAELERDHQRGAGEGADGAAAGEGASAGTHGSRGCGCWRRRLVRHGLVTLGSLRSLQFLLLGLPDDDMPAEEVLEPLAALTGLRCLTLRARGLRAAAAWEVVGPLGRLTQLRNLHLTGQRPDSVAALGAEEAARYLPVAYPW